MKRVLGAAGGEDGGQMIVLVALSMTALLFVVGVAVDSGRLFDARRSAQAAADAGALGGAVTLYRGGTSAQAISDATADAAANGFSSGSGTTVTVVLPPSSGPNAGNAKYVEVTITRDIRTLLLPSQLTVTRARAVAGVAPVDLGYAIIALDTANTANAIRVSAQGSLALGGGGIMINSRNSGAGSNSGSVTITPSTSGTDVVGDASGTWPNKRAGRTIAPDPYAGLPKPDTSGMVNRGNPVCCTLQPGVYTGSVGGNNAWTLSSGVYVFKGAGIDLAGNSSLSGTEVFLFFTTTNYPNTGGSCANPAIKLTGNNASSLTPPSSGDYKGMLMYQDPVCTGTVTIGGTGSITTTGTIYVPSAIVEGNGNNAAITASQIVAKRVDAQNADFSITYSAGTTGTPRIPALTE